MIDRITLELDKDNTPLSIFFDLSKAFHMLDHEILLYKLENYGITGPSLQLVRMYLSDLKQNVYLKNRKSSENKNRHTSRINTWSSSICYIWK